MTLAEMIATLDLELLTTPAQDAAQVGIASGYASDLLSRVLADAPHGGVWVTLQAHSNVVAVAAVLELRAVIITSGARPDPETIAKANEEGVTLLATPRPTFEVVGKLWAGGVRAG